MVTWKANGMIVTLRKDGASYVVHRLDGPVGRPSLNSALAVVRETVHQILAGATGTTGWSLTVEFPQISARYGDARRQGGGGGGGGQRNDVVNCADAIYAPNSQAHSAVENSVQIVLSCWDAAASAA